MKPGYKTTEFYLVVIATLIPMLNSAFGWNIDIKFVMDGLMAVFGLIAYIASRAWIKRTS